MIAGDCILDDITPNIPFEKWITNPLGLYLKSLDKIDRMDINLVLPGHRRVIQDIHKRVNELKDHHKNRLNEVLHILKNGPMNAYHIASQMTWDINCNSRETFPRAQKFFATAEAVTHLELLCNENLVRKINHTETIHFELNPSQQDHQH